MRLVDSLARRESPARKRLSLRSKQDILHEIRNQWFLGKRLLSAGYFNDGINELSEAMESSQALVFGDSGHKNAPAMMSPIWASQFGHLGLLSMFSAAQSIGLVPPNRRTVLTEKIGHPELLRTLESEFDFRNIGATPLARSLVEDGIPTTWTQIEQIELVRDSKGRLTDLFSLWEKVWSRSLSVTPKAHFEFGPEYRMQSEVALSKLGLGPQDPYVAILIRDKFHSSTDHRSASITNYKKSIDYLRKEGYQVVRIGAHWMKPMPPDYGILDLVDVGPPNSFMDPYVLANATFMISTLSGPASVASLLGTPVLWTNVTSIGISTLSGPINSRFLPKRHFLDDDKEMSLREILRTPVGYWDGPEYSLPSSSSLGGYRVSENTPSEILAATKEMIDLVGGEGSASSEAQMRASVVKSECKAISKGLFADSFLRSVTPGWLE